MEEATQLRDIIPPPLFVWQLTPLQWAALLLAVLLLLTLLWRTLRHLAFTRRDPTHVLERALRALARAEIPERERLHRASLLLRRYLSLSLGANAASWSIRELQDARDAQEAAHLRALLDQLLELEQRRFEPQLPEGFCDASMEQAVSTAHRAATLRREAR